MRLLVIVMMLSIAGCGAKNNSHGSVNAVKDDLDTLKTINIPILFTWTSWDKDLESHMNKYGPTKGWELLKNPFGRLIKKENFQAILCISTDEVGSPTLITIDKLGEPIDTLFLLGDVEGNDPGTWTTEDASISKDLTIQLRDSVMTWDLDENSERIESSKKLRVELETYRILETGAIKKIE